MTDYEQLGVFYLGRTFDAAAGRVGAEPVLYDAKDLTTHAVCVGMTGSGKTGLCVTLLEEAAIDGIPVLAIDPKGDLGNLLLTFPELRSEDFAPYVDPDEATRQGMTAAELAAKVAARWKKGLAEWDQAPERIARLKDAAEFVLYTPGSRAGRPLQLLRGLDAPPEALRADADALAERITATVSGLLTLLGIDADPLRSREHVFLSNLLSHAWNQGHSLPPADLIRAVQSPPFQTVGVLDLESFFGAQDRFQLAMRLNALLASPTFQGWTEGEPLDVQRLLWTPQGKPRVSILSIAHLSDAQRMFFVTTLLTEVVAWMRTQPGTSSLRAILYMDEVFGYFPPVANPPSKLPMLTLLKQARAFGVGCVLATQNPVDLDYKGLANCGTWWIGRLQTERDKARVLDGLEGAAAAASTAFSRATIDTLLSGLQQRVFLMSNVHEDAPVLMHSRWALSYLRGPLTKAQVEALSRPTPAAEAVAPSSPPAASVRPAPAAAAPTATPAATPAATPSAGQRPVLPPDIPERFLRLRQPLGGGTLEYRPALLAHARLHFAAARPKVDTWRDTAYLAALDDGPDPWQGAEELDPRDLALDREPDPRAGFAELPAGVARAKSFGALRGQLEDFLYRTARVTVLTAPELKEVSEPDENEGDFRARLRQTLRETRDRDVGKVRDRYAPKVQRLQERIRNAEQKVERERSQVRQSTVGAAVSLGTGILGAIFGRKVLSAGNASRAGSVVRSASRVSKEKADVVEAEEDLRALQDALADMESELAAACADVRSNLDVDTVRIDATEVAPRKGDLDVYELSLCWVPFGHEAGGVTRALR
ncbi:MAG: DUF87 domain-containing protein [Planctomycetota bacterium]